MTANPVATAAVLLGLLLAACGGGAPPDPAEVVRQAVVRLGEGDIDGLTELACAAERDTIRQQFDPTAVLGGALGALGADATELASAFEIDTSNVDVGPVEIVDDRATVRLLGSVRVTADLVKLKELVRRAAADQGVALDDATIDAMIDGLGGSIQQTVSVEQTIALVLEDGRWRICGRG